MRDVNAAESSQSSENAYERVRTAILDACKAGDFVRGAGLLASNLARTGFEVLDLLDPAYDPSLLMTALADAGGDVPAKRSRG